MQKFNQTKVKTSIFLQIFIVALLFNSTIGSWILCVFGFSFFLLPLSMLAPAISIVFYSLFLCIDNVCLFFPYKFCGFLGEFLVLWTKQAFYVPIILGFIFVWWSLVRVSKKAESAFESVEPEVLLAKEDGYSSIIIKILQRHMISAEIKSVEPGHFVTKYYLQIAQDVKFSRFMSLAPELTEILKLKTRPVCDLQYSYLEIENKNKNRLYFSHFKNVFQPNKILLEGGGFPFLLDFRNNFLCFTSLTVIHGFILSLLLTKLDLEILLLGESDPSFLLYNKVILYSPNANLNDLIKEIERRHRVIIPLAEDIYHYNETQKEKIAFLFVFLKILTDLESNILSYILQFGKKVGVFIMLYAETTDLTKKYVQFFSNIITSPTETKADSVDILGISGAEYLCHPHDCLLKHDELLTRVAVPVTSKEEIIKVVHFLENST